MKQKLRIRKVTPKTKGSYKHLEVLMSNSRGQFLITGLNGTFRHDKDWVWVDDKVIAARLKTAGAALKQGVWVDLGEGDGLWLFEVGGEFFNAAGERVEYRQGPRIPPIPKRYIYSAERGLVIE